MQSNGLKAGLVGATFVLLTILAGAVSAQVLDFEGLKDEEAVLNYYNGGMGGSGSGPGPNFGVTFTANSMSVIEADQGGTGNFKLEPTPKTILFFLTGAAATMNVPAGFTTGFSFFYTAAFNPGVINVWSGPDATGTLLATLNLPLTGNGASSGACNFHNFCPFVPIGVSFSGTAHSVDFGGTINQIGFDNITLGSTTAGGAPSTEVPTLSTWAFVLLASLLAFAGIFSLRRKQQRG